jgi:hypothetical protein
MGPGLYAGAMSTTRIRTAIGVMAVAAVVLTGGVTGCAITRDEDSQPPKSASTTEPTETTPAVTPTSSPTATTPPSPSATPSASTSAAATPLAALLAAAEMPQLNPTTPWTEQRTGAAGQRAFGLCQKFDLLTIGAMSAVERTFTSGPAGAPGTATAGQQVADFPDAQNTVRVSKVIEAWQRDCADRVKGSSVTVRPITDVAVPRGKGWSYLVTYERRGTGHVHSLGLAYSGTRMTLIRMDHDGQDHDYEPGTDPMELAVKAAAARLG